MGNPKINCEEVRLQLNGVYSGSSDAYWFWENSIGSGSLWQIISGSDAYLRFLCGDTLWDSTDSNTSQTIKYAEINYVCFKTLVNLSGGVLTDGFNWSLGPTRVETPAMLPAYRGLIDGFKLTSENFIKALLPASLSYDHDQPQYSRTAPSVM